METITAAQWQTFLLVAAAIIGAIILVGSRVKTVKEWKKPLDDLATWKRDVDTKLRNDNDRLKTVEDGNRVICRGILALLSHEINGNSTDKLKSSQQEITDYLIER